MQKVCQIEGSFAIYNFFDIYKKNRILWVFCRKICIFQIIFVILQRKMIVS